MRGERGAFKYQDPDAVRKVSNGGGRLLLAEHPLFCPSKLFKQTLGSYMWLLVGPCTSTR